MITPDSLHKSTSSRFVVLLSILLATYIHLNGIGGLLPFFSSGDRRLFVELGTEMAENNSLNPGWFGHPGSTVIYPIMFIAKVWPALSPEGQILYLNDPTLTPITEPLASYALLGRYISGAYKLLGIAVVFLLGTRLFGPTTGAFGTLLFVWYPLFNSHSQITRTDSASVFWGMLALWLCLKLLDRPTMRNQLFAGAAIGLAISTKYYLGLLVFVLMLADLLILFNNSKHHPFTKRELLTRAMAGGLMIPVAFSLSSPFFILDFGNAFTTMMLEARSKHPGHDGLTWGVT
jgi:hypothetical protein